MEITTGCLASRWKCKSSILICITELGRADQLHRRHSNSQLQLCSHVIIVCYQCSYYGPVALWSLLFYVLFQPHRPLLCNVEQCWNFSEGEGTRYLLVWTTNLVVEVVCKLLVWLPCSLLLYITLSYMYGEILILKSRFGGAVKGKSNFKICLLPDILCKASKNNETEKMHFNSYSTSVFRSPPLNPQCLGNQSRCRVEAWII